MNIGALIRLGRPLFLGGGFILYALGSVMAGHSIDVSRYVIGQCAVTAFQLMTHYANDYFDYEADQANKTPTKWSGGSRVLPAGELPRHVALVAAIVLATLGLVATAALGSTLLDELRPDFPGVTIPKIRFLEDKGLIKPERTPAGYRKFSYDDVDRLPPPRRDVRPAAPVPLIGDAVEHNVGIGIGPGGAAIA